MTAGTRPSGIPAPGITVIEASAGTGKTHRVTSLAVEAVADGLPIESLLLVTFTRAATGELRDRVWKRLVGAEADLAGFLATGAQPVDEVSRRLCDAEPAVVAERHRRISGVVAEFDAATIATIHGFCEQVLSRVGFAGDVERDVEFLEDPRDLTDQVVDDLLVQRFHKNVEFTFERDVARRIADAVITNPHARIVPGPRDDNAWAAMRSRFATAVRSRLEQRKRELRVIGYDDLLTRLEGALGGPQGDVVRARLDEQFRLVVVDEFQDTDVVQWHILRDAFTGGGSTALVLVGDPKQAIYAFRGADVHAYLAAKELAQYHEDLTTNWRSDAGLLRGLDAIFGTATLGHPDIAYRSTEAAEHHRESRLSGGRRSTPVRIRHVRRDTADAILTPNSGDLQMDWARSFVARDLATDVVFQLSSRAEITDRAPDGNETVRVVQPGDIAVLVQRHKDADLVRDALAAVGVPTVVNGAGSVFDTGAAQDWLALLEAIEQPAATTRVRSASMTAFFGWTAEQVATNDDAAWDRVHARLHEWRRVLVRRGVASLFEQINADESLPGRMLGVLGGERALTDVRHVAELLHDHGSTADTMPATLLAWLRERIRRSEREGDAEAQSRRLETDAQAVQVWTIHRSKGLEFPIVHLPFLWRPGWIPDEAPPLFHDPVDGVRCIDVGGSRRGHQDNVDRFVAESQGEELRLAYVALTRARHQVVVWWASTYSAGESPLGTLLLGPHRAPADPPRTPEDDKARTILDLVASSASGDVAIERASGGTEDRWEPPATSAIDLAVRPFDRTIDRTWRRTSYSALTAAAHDAQHAGGYATEHDDRGLEDERLADDAAAVDVGAADLALEAQLRAVPSVFGEMGGGARFGTLVHAVLEEVDFTAADLTAEIRTALDAVHRSGHDEIDAERLVAGLVAAVETPLGPSIGDLRLRDVPPHDRLDEMHFELPLIGGDRPHGTSALTVAAIADVVARTLPADDPLAGYHEDLRAPELDAAVRGYLSGSIDIVLRSAGRFYVVDHKSNWLGVDGEELSAWHYRPDALRDAMVRAHYPLQAMLYSAALHRYLRWRVPGYDPDTHLGGVLYLFLRGMTGESVARVDGAPCGVFAWTPPTSLTVELSELLDRGPIGDGG